MIHLENYRAVKDTKKSKVFIGRDRGKWVREKSRLSLIEQENEMVTIVIPDDIYSINPSFLKDYFLILLKK